jgi:hypothetical protein
MHLIKKTLIIGFLLVLASAGAFAMYNRGAFDGIKFDQVAAFSGFFENQVRPRLPNPIANMFPKSEVPIASTTATESANTQVALTPQTAQTEIQTLTERSQEVSQEIGKVLGEYVQVNEEDVNKPLHEKAFEYGQYLYCQQVIKQFEASASAVPAPPN